MTKNKIPKPRKIDFTRHKTCIFGIQESGKSHWMRKMYKQGFKRALVFQLNEDDGWDRNRDIVVYKVDRAQLKIAAFKTKKPMSEIMAQEMETFLQFAHEKADKGDIDLIIIDEADMFFRGNYDINWYLQDLILNHRHMGKPIKGVIGAKTGVALWFATRRPQDIPTKVVESSKHLVIFKLEGYNAIQRFKEIHPELPEYISRIDKNKHQWVYKELGETPTIMAGLSK